MMLTWVACSALFAGATARAQDVPITTGAFADYQPSVIRPADGSRIVVFERLDGALSGDLWITRSTDDSATWSTPGAIVASASNERHPALLQLADASFVLFYLKGTGAASSFRIWRATSSDGISFSEQSPIDLGWSTGGEINPHVIRHADGTLTMSYQRLGAGSYVAQSYDDGVGWDTARMQIAAGSQLPRIAYREADGLYLASYQVGSSTLQMFVETTNDITDWSAPAQAFAITANNHDSLPIVMPDGAFVLFWVVSTGGPFDIVSRRSLDGLSWQPMLSITASAGSNDVQPHPLAGASAGTVELYWGRETPPGSVDYDIVRRATVVVLDALFAHGFED